jgi:mono/diheme cytochrome c family protein
MAALALITAGCSGKMSWQAMAQQPRAEPYEGSRFFADGSSARPLVEGVVARGSQSDDELLNTGRQNGELADLFPFVIDREALERGRERFDIYCAPCHDRAGTGQGVVVRRGYSPPPSLHAPRLREAPAGYFFEVISNGFGAMPSYAEQVPVADRWAIVAYVRALQLSQNATLDDVPPEDVGRLGIAP